MESEEREQELLARIHELEAEKEELSSQLRIVENINSSLLNDSFLESLISIIPDLFWLKSPEGKYLYCNRSFERFFGIKREEILGKTDYDIVDKDLADFFRQKDLSSIEIGGPSKNEELLTFAEDGQGHLMETIKTPLFNDQKEVIGVLGIGRDITELQETRLRLESLMNRSSEAFIIFDSRGIAVDAGAAITRFLLNNNRIKPAEPVRGKHFRDLFSQYMNYEPFSRYEKFLSSSKPRHLYSTFLHRETDRWYRVQMFTMATGFAVVGSDITELHRAKEEIITNKDMWQSFLDSTANVMGVVDRHNRLASVNQGILKYLPQLQDTEELLGRPVDELIHYLNESSRIIGDAYDRVRQTGRPELLEDSFALGDRIRWLKYHLFKVGDGVGFIVEDTTEMKALENQILQMQKIESVGRLAGGIAHDFNNILGIIIGYTDLALASQENKEETEQYLREIKKAGIKSSRLVSQLLTFARKQSIKPEVIDLNQIISGMLTMLSNLMKGKVNLEWEPGIPLRPIRIDPLQVDQILANLCVNARDAIESNGVIHIATDLVTIREGDKTLSPEGSPGEYVRLTIRDNGTGIDEKTLPYIFEPFFTTKGVGQGTGLGLSTVFGIMKQNGGFIRIESIKGEGTAAELYFPPYSGEERETHDQHNPESLS